MASSSLSTHDQDGLVGARDLPKRLLGLGW